MRKGIHTKRQGIGKRSALTKELGVGVGTIKEWKRLLKETGRLEKRDKQRSASKFHSEELKAYVKVHPEATLEEIARGNGA